MTPFSIFMLGFILGCIFCLPIAHYVCKWDRLDKRQRARYVSAGMRKRDKS